MLDEIKFYENDNSDLEKEAFKFSSMVKNASPSLDMKNNPRFQSYIEYFSKMLREVVINDEKICCLCSYSSEYKHSSNKNIFYFHKILEYAKKIYENGER